MMRITLKVLLAPVLGLSPTGTSFDISEATISPLVSLLRNMVADRTNNIKEKRTWNGMVSNDARVVIADWVSADNDHRYLFHRC